MLVDHLKLEDVQQTVLPRAGRKRRARAGDIPGAGERAKAPRRQQVPPAQRITKPEPDEDSGLGPDDSHDPPSAAPATETAHLLRAGLVASVRRAERRESPVIRDSGFVRSTSDVQPPQTFLKGTNPVSKCGRYRLSLSREPEARHRARYQTEGSRGAVKDASGKTSPQVVLHGCTEPVALQMYVASDADGCLPHLFYQSCRVTGKTSSPSDELLIGGTVVIQTTMTPDKEGGSVSARCDCLGILKQRNVDIESRVAAGGGPAVTAAPAGRGRSSTLLRKGARTTSCRLVFRVTVRTGHGRAETLQIASRSILCTQPQGIPEITKLSICEAPADGGQELILLGKNFVKDSRVVFTETGEGGATVWSEAVVPHKDHLQAVHLVCDVPAHWDRRLTAPRSVSLTVRSGDRESDAVPFTYIPHLTAAGVSDAAAAADTEPSSTQDRSETVGGKQLPNGVSQAAIAINRHFAETGEILLETDLPSTQQPKKIETSTRSGLMMPATAATVQRSPATKSGPKKQPALLVPVMTDEGQSSKMFVALALPAQGTSLRPAAGQKAWTNRRPRQQRRAVPACGNWTTLNVQEASAPGALASTPAPPSESSGAKTWPQVQEGDVTTGDRWSPTRVPQSAAALSPPLPETAVVPDNWSTAAVPALTPASAPATEQTPAPTSALATAPATTLAEVLTQALTQVPASTLTQALAPAPAQAQAPVPVPVSTSTQVMAPAPAQISAPASTFTQVLAPAPALAQAQTPAAASTLTQIVAPAQAQTPALSMAPVLTQDPTPTVTQASAPAPILAQGPVPAPVLSSAPTTAFTPALDQAPAPALAQDMNLSLTSALTPASILAPIPALTTTPVLTSTPAVAQTKATAMPPALTSDLTPSLTPAPAFTPAPAKSLAEPAGWLSQEIPAAQPAWSSPTATETSAKTEWSSLKNETSPQSAWTPPATADSPAPAGASWSQSADPLTTEPQARKVESLLKQDVETIISETVQNWVVETSETTSPSWPQPEQQQHPPEAASLPADLWPIGLEQAKTDLKREWPATPETRRSWSNESETKAAGAEQNWTRPAEVQTGGWETETGGSKTAPAHTWLPEKTWQAPQKQLQQLGQPVQQQQEPPQQQERQPVELPSPPPVQLPQAELHSQQPVQHLEQHVELHGQQQLEQERRQQQLAEVYSQQPVQQLKPEELIIQQPVQQFKKDELLCQQPLQQPQQQQQQQQAEIYSRQPIQQLKHDELLIQQPLQQKQQQQAELRIQRPVPQQQQEQQAEPHSQPPFQQFEQQVKFHSNQLSTEQPQQQAELSGEQLIQQLQQADLHTQQPVHQLKDELRSQQPLQQSQRQTGLFSQQVVEQVKQADPSQQPGQQLKAELLSQQPLQQRQHQQAELLGQQPGQQQAELLSQQPVQQRWTPEPTVTEVPSWPQEPLTVQQEQLPIQQESLSSHHKPAAGSPPACPSAAAQPSGSDPMWGEVPAFSAPVAAAPAEDPLHDLPKGMELIDYINSDNV